jgi:tetratricopeptide (TPR) repeat protein
MKVAVLVLLARVLLAQDYSRSPGYAAYRRADQLFVKKQIPEAVRSLEEALKQDEQLVPALTLYARIAMTMNRFELARNSLDRALSVEPKSASVQFLYGLSYYLSNDIAQAMKRFERARQLDPKDGRAALYLGMTEESLGRLTEAMSQYEDAVRIGPSVEAWLTGARLLELEDRLEQARRWIDQALLLDPASRDGHFEKARLLLKTNEPAAAAKEGEEALSLPQGSIADKQIHYLLARAYRNLDAERAERHAAAARQ